MVPTSMQRVLREARRLPRQTQTQLAIILLEAPLARKESQKGFYKKTAPAWKSYRA